MSREELAQAVADIGADYLPRPLTRAHVEAWIAQFPGPAQAGILKELAHILSRTYFSKDYFRRFFQAVVMHKSLVILLRTGEARRSSAFSRQEIVRANCWPFSQTLFRKTSTLALTIAGPNLSGSCISMMRYSPAAELNPTLFGGSAPRPLKTLESMSYCSPGTHKGLSSPKMTSPKRLQKPVRMLPFACKMVTQSDSPTAISRALMV
jgi:hypothetical protein